jgi:hypothetical protein
MYTRRFWHKVSSLDSLTASRIVTGAGTKRHGCVKRVAQRVKAAVEAGDEVAVVVSAMAGTTDQLDSWTREAASLHDVREYDVVVSAGEQITVGLMAMALQDIGVPARSWLGWQIPIESDDIHGSARIQRIDAEDIERRFAEGQIPPLRRGTDSHRCRLSGGGSGQPGDHLGPRRHRHHCGGVGGRAVGRTLRHLHRCGRCLHRRSPYRVTGTET